MNETMPSPNRIARRERALAFTRELEQAEMFPNLEFEVMPNVEQKFVCLLIKDKKTEKTFATVATLLGANLHKNIIDSFKEKYGNTGDIEEYGGGRVIEKEDGSILFYDKSIQFGSFNREILSKVVNTDPYFKDKKVFQKDEVDYYQTEKIEEVLIKE